MKWIQITKKNQSKLWMSSGGNPFGPRNSVGFMTQEKISDEVAAFDEEVVEFMKGKNVQQFVFSTTLEYPEPDLSLGFRKPKLTTFVVFFDKPTAIAFKLRFC